MHIPVRGEGKERLVLVLGACQTSQHPAHVTPLFHVQAVQDTAESQAESIIFTLQKHLLLERQNAGQSRKKSLTGSLWGGQVSALQNKQALPLCEATRQGRDVEAARSVALRDCFQSCLLTRGREESVLLFLEMSHSATADTYLH